MGEDRCPPPPVEVRIVRGDSAPGVPTETLGQYLLRNGIIKDLPAPIAGGFIEDFGVDFEINCVLSPLEREEVDTSGQSVGAANGLDITIAGIPNRVRVIRSLSFEIALPGGPGIPDDIAVLFDAQVALFPGTHLFQAGPFPASDLVIGDVSSPLTSHMRQLLPLALLPGDELVFRQQVTPAVVLSGTVRTFEEQYLLPFRPPGL